MTKSNVKRAFAKMEVLQRIINESGDLYLYPKNINDGIYATGLASDNVVWQLILYEDYKSKTQIWCMPIFIAKSLDIIEDILKLKDPAKIRLRVMGLDTEIALNKL